MPYFSTAVIPAAFGDNFRRERRQRKLTQAEVAKTTGLTRQTIIQIEKGENVGLHAIMSALAALNMGLRIDTATLNYDDVENMMDDE